MPLEKIKLNIDTSRNINLELPILRLECEISLESYLKFLSTNDLRALLNNLDLPTQQDFDFDNAYILKSFVEKIYRLTFVKEISDIELEKRKFYEKEDYRNLINKSLNENVINVL